MTWTALVQRNTAHQGSLPQQRASSVQVREVDVVDVGQVDEVGNQRDGVEILARLAEDTDVEVARLRFGAGRAAEHGEDPDRVLRAQGIEPARRRGGAEPGQSLRRCVHLIIVARVAPAATS